MRRVSLLLSAAVVASGAVLPARAQFLLERSGGTFVSTSALGGEAGPGMNVGLQVSHRFGRTVDATVGTAYFDRSGAVDAEARLGATHRFGDAWGVRAETAARLSTSERPDGPFGGRLAASGGVFRAVPLSEHVTAYPTVEARSWYGFDYGLSIPVVATVSKRVQAGVSARVGINSPVLFTYTVQTRLR